MDASLAGRRSGGAVLMTKCHQPLKQCVAPSVVIRESLMRSPVVRDFGGSPVVSPTDLRNKTLPLARSIGLLASIYAYSQTGRKRSAVRQGRLRAPIRKNARGCFKGAVLTKEEAPPTKLNPDSALERTLGNGTYQQRVVAGVGIAIYSTCVLYSLYPILVDFKLAADMTLPGLTKATLPMASTAFFVGWLVGSLGMGPIVARIGKQRLLIAAAIGHLFCVFAGIFLPVLTSGSIISLAAVRLATGVCVAPFACASALTLECMPPTWRTRTMVLLNVGSSVMAAAMACLSGTVMKQLNWRLDTMLWCGTPAVVALLFGLPYAGESLSYLAGKGRRREAAIRVADIARKNGASMPPEGISIAAEQGSVRANSSFQWSAPLLLRLAALAVCFLACGCGYIGLNFCIGAFSPDVYTNIALLAATDVLGFAAALGADSCGLRAAQGGAFIMAGVCLHVCMLLTPGHWPVVAWALAGRLFIGICYTTVYVAAVSSFPAACRTGAMAVGQVMARLGGVIGALCGSLPASVTFPMFGALCLTAAACTLTLRQHVEQKES